MRRMMFTFLLFESNGGFQFCERNRQCTGVRACLGR